MTPQTQKQTPSPRALRFNREARALAEAEALGVNLRDPFGMGWAEGPQTAEELATAEAEAEELDSLIYGRAWAGLL